MARPRKNKSREVVQEVYEKDDDIFRLHFKTNNFGDRIIMEMELPNMKVHVRNYGNIPSYELLIPYIEQTYEYYLDGEFKGICKLLDADKYQMKYEEIRSK